MSLKWFSFVYPCVKSLPKYLKERPIPLVFWHECVCDFFRAQIHAAWPSRRVRVWAGCWQPPTWTSPWWPDLPLLRLRCWPGSSSESPVPGQDAWLRVIHHHLLNYIPWIHPMPICIRRPPHHLPHTGLPRCDWLRPSRTVTIIT